MKEWFAADPLRAVLYIIALPSTVILFIQTILLLFGVGGHDADVDVGGDNGIDGVFGHDTVGHDDPSDIGGLRLFTVRGLVAFFAVGGWSGIAALDLGASRFVSGVAAFLMGTAALILVALFFRFAVKLQQDGNLHMENAVGKSGEVYLTVPAKGSGKGKVNIVVQEQMMELDAVNASDTPLRFGERVKVTGLADGNTVIVEKA